MFDMASEKSISVSLQILKSGITARGAKSYSADLSGTNYVATVISATTSWVAIPLGALASFEILYLCNQDATNFIQVATDNAGAKLVCKLKAGQAACWYPDPSTTLYIKADTAACDVAVVSTEP